MSSSANWRLLITWLVRKLVSVFILSISPSSIMMMKYSWDFNEVRIFSIYSIIMANIVVYYPWMTFCL